MEPTGNCEDGRTAPLTHLSCGGMGVGEKLSPRAVHACLSSPEAGERTVPTLHQLQHSGE